jgi:hypothetical protein
MRSDSSNTGDQARLASTYVQRLTVQEIFVYQASHIRQHLGDIKAGLSG